MADIAALRRRFDNLKSERSHFDKAWEDCRIFAMPSSLPIYGNSYVPEERDRKNFDSTAELASRNLASVVMSSITNPSTKWVQIESLDDEVNKRDPEAKIFFEDVEKIITRAYENSNCYIKLYEFYKSLIVYGTGVMFVEECNYAGKDINFRTIHIAELYMAENDKSIVDVVFREVKMTARQIVQKFGMDAVSDKVKAYLEKQSEELIDVVHATFPREDIEYLDTGMPRPGNDNMPYASVWWEQDQMHQLEETGFRTFPYVISRWDKEAGQVYGHGPIMEGLSDIKALNAMERSRLMLAQLLTKPPLAQMGGDSQEVKLTPGAVNHFDEEVKIQPLVTGGNYPVTDRSLQEKRRAVQDALYVNQLHLVDEREMTAEEVRARQMENLRILGPVGSRINSEALQTLILRSVDILDNKGKLPPLPASIQQMGYTFRFLNQFSRAQRMDEVRAVQSALSMNAQLREAYPETKNVLDAVKGSTFIYEQMGVPPTIIRDEATRTQMDQQDQARLQQAQQMAMASQQSENQKNQAQAQEKMSRVRRNDREG
jgi:hypothetical protein